MEAAFGQSKSTQNANVKSAGQKEIEASMKEAQKAIAELDPETKKMMDSMGIKIPDMKQGEKIAITFDGKWVAFSTKATNLGVPASIIVMNTMKSGSNKVVSSVVGSSVGRPPISQSGSYVVFGIGGKLDSKFQSSGIFAN